MAQGGRCRIHRCRVVPVGGLWHATCPQARSACPYGCPNIDGTKPHHCPRLRAKALIVCPKTGLQPTLSACAKALGGELLGHNGAVVRVATAGPFEQPSALQILKESPTVAALARIAYSHPQGSDVTQFALVLPGGNSQLPLFPVEKNQWMSIDNVRVEIVEMAVLDQENRWSALGKWHVQTLLAVQASPCAKARWAHIMGGVWHDTAADQLATELPPRAFAGTTAQPAAYRRVTNSATCTCIHCGRTFASVARYFAECAPEHSALAQ